jgi:hypothetical protein
LLHQPLCGAPIKAYGKNALNLFAANIRHQTIVQTDNIIFSGSGKMKPEQFAFGGGTFLCALYQ